MKRKRTPAKSFIGCLAFVLTTLLTTHFVSAQCGNYFKMNYRAVNKVPLIGNIPFKMHDWNGDGKSDFWNLKSNPNGLTKDIIIYPSKPTGYWDWDHPIVYTTSLPSSATTYNSFVIKDFNSDGKMDIFIQNRIHQNVNNETFIQLATPSADLQIGVLPPVDVNGDGLLDWLDASAFNGQNSFGYYPGTIDGAFGARVNIVANSDSYTSTAVGDFNGDGKPDIVYGTTGAYRILLNAGGGTFSVGNLTTDSHGHHFTKMADFNGDGRTDVMSTDNALTRLFIFYGQANGTFTEQEIPVNARVDYTTHYHPADLNGDNKLDILITNEDKYSAYLNNGAGNFTRTDYPRSVFGRGTSPLVEDFSGDNKADVYDNTPLFEFSAFNTFGETVTAVRENVCQPFGETKRANFDGSYEGDLVIRNAGTGAWITLNHDFLSNAIGGFTLGSTGDIPAHGDYDGDGRTDYAVFNTSSGDWRIRRSSDNAMLTMHFGLGGDIAVPNDYDGGGKTDIAVFRPSDGNWYIFSTETQQVVIKHFGLNGDRPVPADYDGDGKTDIAVYRPSDGNWYYYKSSDQSVVILHWGISTDKPLPADYDGDGRADLAVYRDGDWYILRSGSFSYNFIHWGTVGDIPMPMQRDGNSGSAELIVYRPSNGYWYNYRVSYYQLPFSTSGYAPVLFGLPNN
jgi:hypothetical protein